MLIHQLIPTVKNFQSNIDYLEIYVFILNSAFCYADSRSKGDQINCLSFVDYPFRPFTKKHEFVLLHNQIQRNPGYIPIHRNTLNAKSSRCLLICPQSTLLIVHKLGNRHFLRLTPYCQLVQWQSHCVSHSST